MSDTQYLDWPFLEARHKQLAIDLDAWATRHVPHDHDADIDTECRSLVRSLGQGGWLRHAVGGKHGAADAIDTRAICLVRETLARHSGLADFAFAMQGLGSGAISLRGTSEQKDRYLPRVAAGEAIAAFALSEPDAGSDVAAMTTRATRVGTDWVLNGCKTWISNGGIADFYCVFARTSDEGGARGISAFVVAADAPGLVVAERIAVIAPHPLARLEFRDCRVPGSMVLGAPGEGFRLAMRTLGIFRASVGAAAVGFARRALDAALAHARARRMFGGTLGERDVARAMLGDMGTAVDAAALLVYRAAWLRDVRRERATAEAAQRVIDRAVQLHGGLGIKKGVKVEELYREIRALRIYEGATEVQKIVIARELLKNHPRRPAVAAE